jgi:hypothetical protein
MPDVFNDVNREPIIALAARYSVPAIDAAHSSCLKIVLNFKKVVLGREINPMRRREFTKLFGITAARPFPDLIFGKDNTKVLRTLLHGWKKE